MPDLVERDRAYLAERPAWWGGEDVTSEKALTVPELLARSPEINFRVATAPAYLKIGEEYVEVPNQYGTYRVDDRRPFTSGLSERYTPIQVEEGFTVLQELAKSQEVLIESALSLKGGALVVITARRPDNILVAGERYNDYLVFALGHDGTHSAMMWATKVRIVCWNTFSYSLRAANRIHKVRHTRNYGEKLSEATQALRVSRAYTDELIETGERLAERDISDGEWFRLMDELWPVKDVQGAALTRREKAREQASDIYFTEPNLKPISGTAWAAVQALIQHNDFTLQAGKRREVTFANTVEGKARTVNEALRYFGKALA